MFPNQADVGVLPSGSRSRGTPSLFCAMLKASSRFSRADFSSACFISTKVESIAFMIAKKARPLLQLLAKSWTATPYLNRITYSLHGWLCYKIQSKGIIIFKDFWKLKVRLLSCTSHFWDLFGFWNVKNVSIKRKDSQTGIVWLTAGINLLVGSS